MSTHRDLNFLLHHEVNKLTQFVWEVGQPATKEYGESLHLLFVSSSLASSWILQMTFQQICF
jgi:hypothetical protein